MFFDLLRDAPGRTAVDDGERVLSFADLGRSAAHWQQRFIDQGLEPGQHIAVLSHNRAEIIEVVLGALYCGLWVVPLNSHLAPAELQFQLMDAEIALLVAEPTFAVQLPAGINRWSIVSQDTTLPPRGEACSLPDMKLPAGGVMMYTSGTSGKPRGVKRAQPATVGLQFAANAEAGRQLGLDGSGPHLLLGPMYHAAPFLFALYDLFNGATLYIQGRFDPLAALAIIQGQGIVHTHCVPTMFVRLLKLPAQQRQLYDLSSLTLVLHGAAPVSPSVKKAMIAWLGPVLTEYWGGTESGVCTLCNTAEWLQHPGTVGRSWSNWEVFAVDEAGRRLPAAREGMLYARHKVLAQPFVYHRDPKKTAEAYRAPHELTLGDYGWVDADGYVTIAARRSDLIIRGGVNVYPAEVEAVLLQHSAVRDAVVYGRADPEWGAMVHAVVEVATEQNGPLDLEHELRLLLTENLAAYKHPQSLLITKAIPRNPAGKVPRLALERMLPLK